MFWPHVQRYRSSLTGKSFNFWLISASGSLSHLTLQRSLVFSGVVASSPFNCMHVHTHMHRHRLIQTHSAGISRFPCKPLERRWTAQSSLSLVICRQSHCAHRRIPGLPSKFNPDYSKLLACLEPSSRTLGYPSAVPLRVPLPVTPAVRHLSHEAINDCYTSPWH